jgi:hypothetical protein
MQTKSKIVIDTVLSNTEEGETESESESEESSSDEEE